MAEAVDTDTDSDDDMEATLRATMERDGAAARWDTLPEELQRRVLRHLPPSTLLSSVQLVSKRVAELAVSEARERTRALLCDALADGLSFVPYRDSKITRLLEAPLGGGGAFAACVHAPCNTCAAPGPPSLRPSARPAARHRQWHEM